MTQQSKYPDRYQKYQCYEGKDCCDDKCIWRDRQEIHKYRVQSIPEYLELVMYYRNKGYYSFRGQRDKNWSLGVGFRFPDENSDNASTYLYHFKKRSLSLPQHDHLPEDDEWRWLFLAQHHGLKTKLLDWSSNPLVAMYFAVENIISKKDDALGGAIWALKVSDEFFLSPNNAKNPDYCIAEDGKLDKEQPKTDWYMVNPPPFTTRIERQSGKFSYHPKVDQNVSDPEVNSIRNSKLVLICLHTDINQQATANARIRRLLGIMNIHHGSMFPEHSGIADFVNYELHDLSPKP